MNSKGTEMKTKDHTKEMEQFDTQPQKVNKSRRRALISSSLTLPVLMTLANRPAFGAVCTVSGFVSAQVNAASAAAHQPVLTTCGGLSPSEYRNVTAYPWPAFNPGTLLTPSTPEGGGNRTGGTIMSNVFTHAPTPNATLYDILWVLNPDQSQTFDQVCIAALLNTYSPSRSQLTSLQVQEIYSQQGAPLGSMALAIQFLQGTF